MGLPTKKKKTTSKKARKKQQKKKEISAAVEVQEETTDDSPPEDEPVKCADLADEDIEVALPEEGEPIDPDGAAPSSDMAVERELLVKILESLLFAADKPLSVKELRTLSGEIDAGKVELALEEITSHYQERGIQLGHVAGGYQFRTHPETAEWVQKLIAGRPVRLSRAQVETLAIVAYRQPITRPEVDDVRGVDSGSTLKVLLERRLVRVLGKKEEPGRPLLYGTTKDFLEFFNLNDLRDLPTLRDHQELSDESQAEVQKLESPDDGNGLEGGEFEATPEEVTTAATEEFNGSVDDMAEAFLGLDGQDVEEDDVSAEVPEGNHQPVEEECANDDSTEEIDDGTIEASSDEADDLIAEGDKDFDDFGDEESEEDVSGAA